MDLMKQYEKSKNAATTIIDRAKAENRDLTNAESLSFEAHLKTAKNAKADYEAIGRSGAMAPKDFANLEAILMRPDELDSSEPGEANTTAFLASSPKSFAKSGLKAIKSMADLAGVTGLVSGGSTALDRSLLPSSELVVESNANRRFLSQLLVPNDLIEQIDGPTASFLQQTIRTQNAAPVAIGGTKPTSIYQIDRVDVTAVTIAHLSEPMPRQYFEDYTTLTGFIGSQMVTGLAEALDEQIVSGDGIDPNFTGIENTTGLQVQAFDTTLLTTARKAVTKLEAIGVEPTAWAMNPADWETVELLTGSDGHFLRPGETPTDAGARRLWGVDVVVSPSVAAGTAYLGNWADAGIYQRGPVNLQWSETTGTDFETNMVRFRCEGRWAFALTRADSFVKVALAAA